MHKLGLTENTVFLQGCVLILCWFFRVGILNYFTQLYNFIQSTTKRRTKNANDMSKIPGPLSLPIVGTLWIFLWRYKMTKVHEAYRDMFKRYGKIVKEVVGEGVFMVSIFSREDIEKVARYPSKYPNRPPSKLIYNYRMERPDRYASAGMANVQGEEWHNLRSKLTSQLISKKTMLLLLPELNNIADDFIHLLRQNRDERFYVDNFDEFACRYGLETSCTLVFGERMTYMEMNQSEAAILLSRSMIQRFKSERDYMYTWGDYTKTKDYQKFIEGEEILYRIVDNIINKAERSSEMLHSEEMKCILMSIVDRKDVDEREKRSSLIDFVAAGILPLRNSLVFLLYLVAKHPEVQKKAYEEMQRNSINTTNMTPNDLYKIPYIRGCIWESYRHIPVAFAIGRTLDEDIVLSGYNVKAGTYITSHTMVACLDENNFTRPNEYLPERWVEGNPLYKECQSAATCIYAPFGFGKRACPGRRFVEDAMLVTFAKIIHEFHVEFDGELDVQFEFVVSAKTPIKLNLRDRH